MFMDYSINHENIDEINKNKDERIEIQYNDSGDVIDCPNEELHINEYFLASIFSIESCKTSIHFILPQLIQNHIKSIDSFQQLWSSQVYSSKLIDSKTSENTFFYPYKKILQNDIVFFTLCYLLGALFGMNAYLFIDFLLILICIISILVVTYEQWFFYYMNFNEYEYNMENKNQYSRQIKLAAYGLVLGIISNFIFK